MCWRDAYGKGCHNEKIVEAFLGGGGAGRRLLYLIT